MTNRFDDFKTLLSGYDLPGSVKVTAEKFDALHLLQSGDFRMGATDSGTKLQSFGSIASMDLPSGYKATKPFADGGSIPLDEALKIYQMDGHPTTKLGLSNRSIAQRVDFNKVNEVFSQKPHTLSDDEYFKVSDMMTPGPWAGNGRGHEISTRTEEINGRKVLVYDYWRCADESKDSPFAKMGPNDIKVRIIYAPNEKTHKIDVMWMEAPVNEFDQRAKDFDHSLKSIKWK